MFLGFALSVIWSMVEARRSRTTSMSSTSSSGLRVSGPPLVGLTLEPLATATSWALDGCTPVVPSVAATRYRVGQDGRRRAYTADEGARHPGPTRTGRHR